MAIAEIASASVKPLAGMVFSAYSEWLGTSKVFDIHYSYAGAASDVEFGARSVHGKVLGRVEYIRLIGDLAG
ncbi:hypothetical protein [Mycobacterium uberis]|uniref:hypothetical protein n=1 Tax=Mycobacterium uberis TaxID=2162698 RepID=UPI00140398D8|nr:hypothetical protein [Mycobacterium uberis]